MLSGLRDGQRVEVPTVFCDQTVAAGLMRWMFRSLTRSLVPHINADDMVSLCFVCVHACV